MCLDTNTSPRFQPEKKQFRLRRNREFQDIYQAGRYFASPELVLYCLPRSEDQPSKIGFAVARKLGNAVRRNRLRRRLREVARLAGDLLPATGLDLILLGRLSAEERSIAELDVIYRSLVKRLHRWMQENPRRIAKGRKS